jgi:hypothetical protein
MGINRKGRQGQTERAVALQEEEEEGTAEYYQQLTLHSNCLLDEKLNRTSGYSSDHANTNTANSTTAILANFIGQRIYGHPEHCT